MTTLPETVSADTNMKTRITFVTWSFGPGGAEKHLIDLVIRLDPARTDCVILCYGQDCYTSRLKQYPHVKVVSFTKVVIIADAVCRGALSYWMDFVKFRPHTIVFVNGCLGLFRWPAYLAARLSGAKKIVAIEHSMASPAPPAIVGSGARNYLRRRIGWRARTLWRIRLAGIVCHKTICVSNAVRERLVNQYEFPQAKTMTILNGVDLSYYGSSNGSNRQPNRAVLGMGNSDEIILCIANLTVPKRIDVLLEAFGIVVNGHPSSKCVILGSGPLEAELRAYTSRLGLTDKVLFAGYVHDVRPYLEVADLFVMSSDKEGLPLSLAEAMAYGLPCVVTDAGGNREIVVHGRTGLVVKPGFPEQLATAINYLLVHTDERVEFGLNGKQRVREHFNIETSMEKLKAVLLGQL